MGRSKPTFCLFSCCSISFDSFFRTCISPVRSGLRDVFVLQMIVCVFSLFFRSLYLLFGFVGFIVCFSLIFEDLVNFYLTLVAIMLGFILSREYLLYELICYGRCGLLDSLFYHTDQGENIYIWSVTSFLSNS